MTRPGGTRLEDDASPEESPKQEVVKEEMRSTLLASVAFDYQMRMESFTMDIFG